MITYLTDEFVPDKLYFCYFVNNRGELWTTPKGKQSWSSPRAASTAFRFHTGSRWQDTPPWRLITIEYTHD